MTRESSTARTPGLSRIRLWWWLTLLVTPVIGRVAPVWWRNVTSLEAITLRVVVGYLAALPLAGAIPAVSERSHAWRSRLAKALMLTGVWVFGVGAVVVASLVPLVLSEWQLPEKYSWPVGLILACMTALFMAQHRRPPAQRLLLYCLGFVLVLIVVATWARAETLTYDLRLCLALSEARWQWKATIGAGSLLSAAALDCYRRRRAPGSRVLRAASALGALIAVATILYPSRPPRLIGSGQIERIWRAQMTSRGDLLLGVTLRNHRKDVEFVAATVLVRRGQNGLARLSTKPDFFGVIGAAADGRQAVCSECPPLWRALSCRPLHHFAFDTICPEHAARIVDLETMSTTKVFENVVAYIDDEVPVPGPRGSWLHHNRIRLTSGRVIDAPAPADGIVARWYDGNELAILWQSDKELLPVQTRLSRIDVDSGAIRTAGVPIEKPIEHWFGTKTSPDAHAVLVRVDDEPENSWALVDRAGKVEPFPALAEREAPVFVWRRDGTVDMVPVSRDATSTILPDPVFSDFYQVGDRLYGVSQRCRDEHPCLVETDDRLQPTREIAATDRAQWIDRSFVFFSDGRRVSRYRPETDRFETLFEIP